MKERFEECNRAGMCDWWSIKVETNVLFLDFRAKIDVVKQFHSKCE